MKTFDIIIINKANRLQTVCMNTEGEIKGDKNAGADREAKGLGGTI